MDDWSASRLAAYRTGRGAEYDDTVAARKELAQTRGDQPSQSVDSHSLLSDPVVLARRRQAAQKEKLAVSAVIEKEAGPNGKS
jgi:hypothetical protein